MPSFSRTLTLGIVFALVLHAMDLSAQGGTLLVDGARQEVKLVFYTSTGAPLALVKSAFEKRFPFITIELVTGTAVEVTKRFLGEFEKGVKSADVIALDQAALFDILQKPESLDWYLPRDSEWLAADLRDKDGRWASPSPQFLVIAYNTRLVPKAEAPKSYQDLLDRKWSGKVGFALPTGAPEQAAIWKSMEKRFGGDFIRQLAAQQIEYLAAGTLSKLATGEISIAANLTADSVEAARLRGDPVDWARMDDTTYFANLSWMGMAPNPPHPNAARLWIGFWFSKQGQQALADGGNVVSMPGIRLSHPDLAIQGKKLIQLEHVADAERDAFLKSFSAKYGLTLP